MSRSLVLFSLLVCAVGVGLVACGGTALPPPHCDGGCPGAAHDAANDGYTAANDELCTTSACAAAPCTTDCMYQLRGSGCPSTLPATIAQSQIASCKYACSALTVPSPSFPGSISGGFCSAFIPGCVLPLCGYTGVCYDFTDFFTVGQAVICPAAANCQSSYSGGGEDASAECDLSVPHDMASIDGGTSD